MIRCMPIVTAIDKRKIAFNVAIVETSDSIDTIHTMDGGLGYSGKKIGEASVILKDAGEQLFYHPGNNMAKVVYITGYRYDGKDFCVETEKIIAEACKEAAEVIWGL